MCDTSAVNNLLGGGGAAAATWSSSSTVPTIAACKLRHSRDRYYLIDIREAEEIADDPLPKQEDDFFVEADVEVPMGKLLAVGVAEGWIKEQGIVLLCNDGYRSAICARELAAAGGVALRSKVMALQQGLVGLRHPSATVPDTVVLLATKSDPEKITLALNASAVAAQAGDTVVLALMGDGVCTFLRKGNNKELPSDSSYRIEETFIGEPFQPCHALMNKFIGSGNGVILACTSCIKSRGMDFGSDLLDCVSPMQMPDLIRMLGQAKKTMQFM